MYLTTCWTFAAVRWWHTCSQPKERHRYIWPDRNMQCLLYMCATVLLPYVIDPTSPSAWLLQKSYFPATYSNPDDYARRVWLFPVILTPLIWPAYILDSPAAMAVQNVLLAVSNVWLLLTVMPVWRRRAILAMPEAEHPAETKEAAALAAGFSSYTAYYRAKQKLVMP
ncbi:MAG: hypothetical protein IKH32_10620 [Prevotella sp.]|nr:hypothetical protein [Prevotella sp.]